MEVCSGMCAAHLPRTTRESQWRTLMDDWPCGRGRGNAACVLCTADKRAPSASDSTRHAVLECPYAAAVLEAVARAWAATTGCSIARARTANLHSHSQHDPGFNLRRRWRGAVAAALAVARAAPAAAQQHIQPMEEDADSAPTLLGKRPSAGSGGRVDAVRTRAAAASPSSSPGGRRAAPSSRASPSPHPPGPLPAGPPALAAPARREQGAGQPPAGCGSTPGRDALLAREMVMPAAPADGAAALAPARGGASSLV